VAPSAREIQPLPRLLATLLPLGRNTPSRGPEAPRTRGPLARGGRPDLERELEEARRLGHWFTEEDRQLLREHEAEQARDRRNALLRRAGRNGAVGLMVAATLVPPLWPVAILAGVRAFPTTSRRLGAALAISAGVALVGTGAVVVQVGRSLLAPETATPVLSSAPVGSSEASAPQGFGSNAGSWGQGASGLEGVEGARLGRDLATRLEGATDYWTLEGRSPDGTATWRKGLYQRRDGATVMVLPGSSWALLGPRERRALAEHVRAERDVRAIHVGRIVAASGFDGNTIQVGERVWP
jgi:hypothetical protein